MSTAKRETWRTLAEIAREMDVTRTVANKDLHKVRWVYPPRWMPGHGGRGRYRLWDHRVIDLLRAMRGLPHRTLEPAHSDWLARYQKREANASSEAHSGGQGPS